MQRSTVDMLMKIAHDNFFIKDVCHWILRNTRHKQKKITARNSKELKS